MGLFSRLFHREEEDGFDPSEYAGMRLEVMDEKENLLFMGRANVGYDGELELQPLTVPQLSPYADNVPVLLRGYDEKEKLAFHIQATLVARGNGIWMAEDCRLTVKDNERSFFRQPVNSGGEITPLKQWGINSNDCRVLNISAGGVCVWTDAAFLPGERVLVKADILDEWSIKPQVCVVRRATKRRFGFEYGCEFASLPTETEEKITRVIMEMQRRSKQRSTTEQA